MKSSADISALAGRKILFASMPAEGHVNPLTGLAKYLQAAGADVRWYTGSSYQEKMDKLGIPLYAYRRAVDVNAANLEEVFPGREKIRSQVKKLVFDIIHFFIGQAPKFLEDLKEIRQEFPFELVIAESTFTGIPLIEKTMNLPVLGIGIVPLVETSKDLAPPGLGITPIPGIAGKIKHRILRYVADKILFSKPNKLTHQIMENHGVEHGGSNIFDLMVKKATIFLQSGTPGFEYKRSDLGKNIRYIGALLPYSNKKEFKPWHDARLTQYNRIVLVTQGTVEKDVEKLLVPTLEAFKNTDTLVICTTGGSQTAELRQRFPQNNLIIGDFIPFACVMPYANAYITNGGYGGVMLGIENKLPMVVAGVHEGKNEICARVGYFKLGINLKTEKPTAAQIKMAVNKLMASSLYRSNVEKLSKEFQRYSPGELCASYAAFLLEQPANGKTKFLSKEAAA